MTQRPWPTQHVGGYQPNHPIRNAVASSPTPYYQDDAVTIYHGDSREILPELHLGPCAWVMDPPYSSGGFQEAGKVEGSIGKWEVPDEDKLFNDQLSTRGYMNLMREVLRHSRTATEIAVFTDWRMWINTWDALEFSGFVMRAMLVWAKGEGGIGRPWRNAHELIAYGMRVQARKDRIAKSGNVLSVGRSRNENHPTEKPVGLVTRLIDNIEPELIVDPFMGSGTTLVAAKSLGRRAIGIEYDVRYCAVAAQRCAQDALALGVA